ncbi:hypothetical protein GCM10011494_13480 [Novosphingobium endophyticum]|uniref:Uncharacterized protein n=1 Tax=Novosphingobium endophyticum TaxID=1955250 RepID=A0A916X514_9SPHN|nr:hypothetical protein [Novosphingobium endophyticum]GGB96286.1 hypothetical protein GCM10011494_13480 [Novosphingobium endophyticum]
MAGITTGDLSGGLAAEREYVLDARPEDGVRDAVNVWIEEESGAFATRVGIEAVAEQWDRHEMWLDVAFADGRLYSRRGDGETQPAAGPGGKPTVRATGPLRFECVEPFRRWTVTFKGQVAVTSAREIMENPDFRVKAWADIAFFIQMDMAAPPWQPGTMTPEAAAAMAGKQGQFMSPRYEQLFRCTGSLTIDGETRTFAANGLRIRRTGFRAFAGFSGHCWMSAVFPSGRAFGLNAYPPRDDGEPTYAEAWVIDSDGRRIGARPVELPWLRKLVTGGEPVPLVLETLEGKRIAIDGVTFANTRSRGGHVLPPDWPKDWPIVQQSHAFYTWDGERTTGMIERSSKPSVMGL